MKKLVFPVILVAVIGALFAATVYADPVGAKLIAGQTEYVGTVYIHQENGYLYVYFGPLGEECFCLKETHLHVADSLDGIPQVNGIPIPGQFDYEHDDLGCADWDRYEIPLEWTAGTTLYIAAHAVVGDCDDPYYEETAWGVICGQIDEYSFGGPRWAAYIPYTVQPSDD